MIKTDIQYFTLSKALSAIGGFISLCLMLYGIFTSFLLQGMFITRLSQKMLKHKDN